MDTRQLLALWLILSVPVSGTRAFSPTVKGARGKSVFLSPGISVGSDVYEIVWKLTSLSSRIVQYIKGNTEIFMAKYKQRITLHPGNFSLEIHDVRRADAGDYEVTVTTGSGAESKRIVRLEVYEPVSGANIKFQCIPGISDVTLTCSVTSGDSPTFRWWREEAAVGDNSNYRAWKHGETVEVHYTAEVKDVVYTCEAWNDVSKDTARIPLQDVCKRDTPLPNTTTMADRIRAHKPQTTILLIRAVLMVIFLISAVSMICWVTWRNGAERSSNRDEHRLQGFECTRKDRSGRQPPEWNERAMAHFSRERRNWGTELIDL
ncbi:CD48 antigen-like [Mobula birostris]|uniref:CD48 antigen-like n=1 Tax=Mobula birostris TaxID=1983395 RepID=UPI003B287CA3